MRNLDVLEPVAIQYRSRAGHSDGQDGSSSVATMIVRSKWNLYPKRNYHVNYLRDFINDEEGQDMVEYALLLAVIALIGVGGATTLGTALSSKFSQIKTKLT